MNQGKLAGGVLAVALLSGSAELLVAQTSTRTSVRNVVLVHGGFVDGSGWEGVYNALKKDGYRVTIVQNPTISLADDVAVTRRVIAAQDGPVILVGHSYGGVVITEAGNDPKVAGLVYIAAFAPDKGESVSTLIKDPPPGAPVPPILPPQDGYLFLDKAKFPASFAADVDAGEGRVHGRLPGPVGRRGARAAAISEPAWKTKPSWYLVATDDKMIPPDAQRAMSKRAGSTVVEVKGSHAIYVSQPQAVASLIEKAALGTKPIGVELTRRHSDEESAVRRRQSHRGGSPRRRRRGRRGALPRPQPRRLRPHHGRPDRTGPPSRRRTGRRSTTRTGAPDSRSCSATAGR